MRILKYICLLVSLVYVASSSPQQREETFRGQFELQKENNTNLNNRQVLITLLKLQIEASRSLCKKLGMSKCGRYCCDEFFQSKQYASRLKRSEIQNLEESIDNEKKICRMIGHEFCGQKCCPAGACDRLTSNQSSYHHLRYFNQLCIQDPVSSQQAQKLCKGAGLLWCDGQCCGFDASKHKCFRINHYGSPYIRCPIQDPVRS